MRIPAGSLFLCTFPDFDDDTDDRVEIDARAARTAAIQAACRWEESINDYRVLRVEETLRVRVEQGGVASVWEVLGVAGRYVAKQASGTTT